jgi:hypothetical protein
MSNVIDMRDPDGRIDRQRHRIVEALRMIAAQLDAMPRVDLTNALPIAAAAVEELQRRLAPWQPETTDTD